MPGAFSTALLSVEGLASLKLPFKGVTKRGRHFTMHAKVNRLYFGEGYVMTPITI